MLLPKCCRVSLEVSICTAIAKISLTARARSPHRLSQSERCKTLRKSTIIERYKVSSRACSSSLQPLFEGHFNDVESAMAASSVAEFDDRFTSKANGFASREAYYGAASCGSHVASVNTPLLFIQVRLWTIATAADSLLIVAMIAAVVRSRVSVWYMIVTRAGSHVRLQSCQAVHRMLTVLFTLTGFLIHAGFSSKPCRMSIARYAECLCRAQFRFQN